ncbi:MAG: aminodeoxychorismate/anthranilate synthase component II [Prevotellaceae bacterium]|jgi:anthranilate synthase component 2|nr:aminodeoxychorismate/anthranilate synthase component II [Prevotellaceae bacterium]
MKILVFDNYDSFTYNLVQLIGALGFDGVEVYRNDKITLDKIADFDKIILSPGPGIPSESGLLLPLIKRYAQVKSILGVCLGHQAIGETFGASLLNLDQVYHGVAMRISVTANDPIFEGLPAAFDAGRYHSWIVNEENFPDELEITAVDDENKIMALRHKTFDVHGVQFHPESVLTPEGKQIINNFLKL